jgi:hypothetical protein
LEKSYIFKVPVAYFRNEKQRGTHHWLFMPSMM